MKRDSRPYRVEKKAEICWFLNAEQVNSLFLKDCDENNGIQTIRAWLFDAQQKQWIWAWYEQEMLPYLNWQDHKQTFKRENLTEARIFNPSAELFLWHSAQGIQGRFRSEEQKAAAEEEIAYIDTQHRLKLDGQWSWVASRNYLKHTEEGLAYFVDQRWLSLGETRERHQDKSFQKPFLPPSPTRLKLDSFQPW